MEESQLHIPDGWEGKELGTLYLEKRKSKFKVSDATNYGGIPFYTSGDAVLEHNEIQTDGENIFLATGGIANVKFYNGKVAYSTDTYVIVGKENISTQFLYFKILDQLYYINTNYFQGSGLKHLQKKDFRKHLFALPKTEIEQTIIANILSKTDQAIANTEALIAKCTRIKTGLMQDLLTKGIDENGNIRSEQTHVFKDSPLGRIPKEWEVKKLDECINKNTTITYGIVQTFEHIVDGVPVLRTIDLKENGINSVENLLRTKKSISDKYRRTLLLENDIVCNVRASVGDFNIVSAEYVNCNTTRGVARICPSNDVVNKYLVWFLKSYKNEKQMELLIKGTTFIDINIGDLRKIWVLLPSKTEQELIADKLDKIQSSFHIYQTELSKLQSLKTGLMQDLLSGKVRVKINN